MTKTEIKAELRRSACEDADPWNQVSAMAFSRMLGYCPALVPVRALIDVEFCGTFFLLVAEAL